ncbi:MAG: class I SAM-dependent methyltransferase [Thermoplasmatota archaeon]
MSPQPVLTNADPFSDFKAKQRDSWSRFAALEATTTPPAARLVTFAGIKPGDRVLDVGCGTGVASITARRAGARVTGLDLTPQLLERARQNSAIAGLSDIDWREGDAEAMPFKDGEFDAVISQYGHIFAPRADVTTREMLRVLRPGGRIAFSTWPPELALGSQFRLTGRYLPPPPGVTPPWMWGDPAFIRERLGEAVRDLTFDRGTMLLPALSLAHYRSLMEETAGPFIRIVQTLQGDPAKLAAFRSEVEAVAAPYYHDNVVKQDFLMTRATKA